MLIENRILEFENECPDNTNKNFWFNQATKQTQNNIHVYPNPSNGLLTFRFDEIFMGTIQVYDAKGKLIYIQKVNATENICTIDLNRVENGIYFYKSKQLSGEEKNGKLIINR